MSNDETVVRDWIQEVSGNQCMEEFGAHTIDAAKERVVQPERFFAEEDIAIEEPAVDSSPVIDFKTGEKADGGVLRFTAAPDAATESPRVSGNAIPVDQTQVDDVVSAEVIAIESNVWFEIAHWAKENDHLVGWQRGLAYSLGVRKRQSIAPTPKQEKQGKRILDEVRQLGFKPSVSAQLMLPMPDDVLATN